LLFNSGSDLPKQEEQLGTGIVDVFPWNFSQNGLVAYNKGQLLEVQTIAKFLGEDNVKRIVNWVLKYLVDIDIPVKVCNGFDMLYFA
jgi:phosphomannomutase